VNYVYGTALVLRGLEAIGMDNHEPCIQQAAEWLRMVQNPTAAGRERGSYDDPTLRGVGESTPSQTAWAFLDCSRWRYAQRLRSPRYRLSAENAKTRRLLGRGIVHRHRLPRVFYLKYHLYRQYFPLLALTTYAKVMEKISD